uniref:Uncharacterized protein n=1 Tax=Ignisphaera aggregans TaxID=334771 RepID=A0A7J2TB23_9CREN
MTYEEVLPVVRELAKEYNIKGNPNNLRKFMEKAFERATVEYDLCKDFQRRAKVYGDVFEAVFMVVIEELFGETLSEHGITLIHDCEIEIACLMGQGKADFVAVDRNGNIKAVIEAKGSASYIVCEGRKMKLKMPGLMRTDTTKKAAANATQVKFGISNNMPYIIVTSHKPRPKSNSECILNLITGSGKLIDMVVDVTDVGELKQMVKYIVEAKAHNIRCKSSQRTKNMSLTRYFTQH